jgi:pyruvate kinase
MARPQKAPTKQASVPIFAHEELKVFIDKLNSRRRKNITAPEMLGALMVAVQRLPLEVAEALIPAYQERERAVVAATRTNGSAQDGSPA